MGGLHFVAIRRGTYLKRRGITQLELSSYALKAIRQISQDSISTHIFAEWFGETDFSIAKYRNAFEWAKNTTQWVIPTHSHVDFGPININTTEFESSIHQYHREERKLGTKSERQKNGTLLWDNLNDSATKPQHLPRGLGNNVPFKLECLLATTTSALRYNNEKQWYQCEDKGELIGGILRPKAAPISFQQMVAPIRKRRMERTGLPWKLSSGHPT